MAVLPTYYLTLEDGSYRTLKNVTAAPTLVDPSGAPIKDAYYRDGGQNFQGLGALPPFLVETDIAAGSATTIEATPTTAQDSFPDEVSHVPPRQLSFFLSYWQFLCAPDPAVPGTTFAYYFRWDRVQGMSTEQPSFF